ncbi:hypothetical protein J2S59_002272 [Nocardioides massiliensis]|uniref:OmpH family outer membrane protein n=2 Tax=Nocardioides massiliensis TaxID=1325935 RepID=A0ABT9NQ01_9ACTN|nr:hypothetical protein [Nocardioides massiliensis]MDP9822463.1 hypothetical protein [Nocardioides massiliensis]
MPAPTRPAVRRPGALLAVLALVLGLFLGSGVGTPVASAAPASDRVSVAAAAQPKKLAQARQQVRRVARQRHEAFRLVREDVRLQELPVAALREIEEAARTAQTRINARVLAAEQARKVARVRKLRAAIAAENAAPLRQRIAAEHAAVLADVNCGPLGRALENNEDGLLGPVVALVDALCL